jgi:hypothetical protein
VDNFFLAQRACTLPDETADVIQTLASVPSVKLVVLDTLQRTMEGDENSTRDMSGYIRALDDIKAAYPDLSIMVVHHTGHGSADRARGSSVLKASLDAEILISKDAGGVIGLQCTKMKDAEPFAPLSFRLESVTLDGWADDDGQPVTSAVLSHLEGHQQAQQPKRGKVSGKNQLAALAILRALQKHSVTNLDDGGYSVNQARVRRFEWQEQCVKERIAEKPGKFMDRIQLPLVNAGAIILEGEYVVPVDFE